MGYNHTMTMIWNETVDALSFIMHHLAIFNCILAIGIVFFRRKDPTSVWAWLLILYAVPILGFILYLLIGGDIHKRQKFRIKRVEDKVQEAILNQEKSLKRHVLQEKRPELAPFTDLIYYNLDTSGAVLTGNNAVRILTDGHELFDRLLDDIRNARESIHIQSYIIRNDKLFDRICAALKEKAAEGVEVRILYDGMGGRFVSHAKWRKLRRAGIEAVSFFPPLLRRFHLRLNYRNHRKIVVIDGLIGYVGGFNIGCEYLGEDPRFGYWRDTHLRIQGAAAAGLQLRFLQDWNFASDKALTNAERYFKTPEILYGNCDIQIISSGPDSDLQNIRNNYIRLIARAKKSIYLQTPYFIPDDAVYSALMMAARSGVEVNLMIPSKPDHPFVYPATMSYAGDLIKAGAKVYTYNNGFIHAKGLIADESVMAYGTANMDIRSFRLNFEVNAIIYSEEQAQKMVKLFKQDLRKCRHITPEQYGRRSLYVRMKEQVCRLLSPLL